MSQIQSKQMAEVEKFKSAIPRVRDILRSCSITGMDSMRHICFYLLSRYITNENVDELEVPTHLSWENIYTKSFEDEDVALQLFKIDLIDQFDNLFGTQQFSFDVKNGVKHKEILEIFNNISMKNIDLHMDILGYVYEQHLKTGSTAARDLGQFFTDRFICEYMVKICEPKIKKGGIPESVCDPTMGTGGFLTAYLKYFKDVDWSKYQNQVHGVDHDAKVAGVCRLNMFMESGGQLFKHLQTADSLHGGLTPTTYDIILANMPFGLKGLKYADVHQSIKALGLNGTKSEPLFLQLMMVSLNKGGRCAVVVPDGMLVNNSKCHNSTRKYLLENFELKRVIKMKGKFFMNTGIQPSILFFENSGKKTEQVEFWDVERNDKGNFSEKVVLSVPIDKFDESYSLDMRKYVEIEKKDYSEIFQIVKLGDICIGENGKTLNSSTKEDGPYKIMGGGTDYNGNHSKYNRDEMILSVSKSGTAGHVKWHSEKFWAGDCFTIKSKNESEVSNKYLYYYLSLNNDIVKSKNTGSTIPHCKWDDVKDIKIPIPSLEIQNQIVEELDAIYESKQNASKMIENLKDQMNNIIKRITYKNYETDSLKNLCKDESTSNNIPSSERVDGEFRFFTCSRDYSTHNKGYYTGEYLIHGSRGSTINESIFITSKTESFAIGTSMFMSKSADNDKINLKYLYYYLKFNKELIDKKINTSAIPMISKSVYYDIYVPVPSLEIQKSIVERLDKLQEQINCLEQIESLADENAKFILEFNSF